MKTKVDVDTKIVKVKNRRSYKKELKMSLYEFLKINKIYELPRFCFSKQMNIAGNCRMCLIEVKNAIKLKLCIMNKIKIILLYLKVRGNDY